MISLLLGIKYYEYKNKYKIFLITKKIYKR